MASVAPLRFGDAVAFAQIGIVGLDGQIELEALRLYGLPEAAPALLSGTPGLRHLTSPRPCCRWVIKRLIPERETAIPPRHRRRLHARSTRLSREAAEQYERHATCAGPAFGVRQWRHHLAARAFPSPPAAFAAAEL
jgi:hypothetical protein